MHPKVEELVQASKSGITIEDAKSIFELLLQHKTEQIALDNEDRNQLTQLIAELPAAQFEQFSKQLVAEAKQLDDHTRELFLSTYNELREAGASERIQEIAAQANADIKVDERKSWGWVKTIGAVAIGGVALLLANGVSSHRSRKPTVVESLKGKKTRN